MSRLAYPMLLMFLLALGSMLWVEHRGTSQLLAWLQASTAQAQGPRDNDPAPAWPTANTEAPPWRSKGGSRPPARALPGQATTAQPPVPPVQATAPVSQAAPAPVSAPAPAYPARSPAAADEPPAYTVSNSVPADAGPSANSAPNGYPAQANYPPTSTSSTNAAPAASYPATGSYPATSPSTMPGRYVPPPQDPALEEAPQPQAYGSGARYGDAPLPKNVPAPADFAGTWLGFPLGATLECEAMPVKAGIVEVQSVNGRRVAVTRIRVSYRQPGQFARTRPDGSQEQITIQMEKALPTTPRMVLRGIVEDRGAASGGDLVFVASEAFPLGSAAPIVAANVPAHGPLPTGGPTLPPTLPVPARTQAAPEADVRTAMNANYPPAPSPAAMPEAPYPTTPGPAGANPSAESAPSYPSTGGYPTTNDSPPTGAYPATGGYPTTGGNEPAPEPTPAGQYPSTSYPAPAPRRSPYATPDRPDFSAERPTTPPYEAQPASERSAEAAPSYADRARANEGRETAAPEIARNPAEIAPAPWARERREEPPAAAEVSIGDAPSEAAISDVQRASYTPDPAADPRRQMLDRPTAGPSPSVAKPAVNPPAASPAKSNPGALMAGDMEITETTILAMVNGEPILAGEVLPMIEPRLAAALAKVPPEHMQEALREVAMARKVMLQQAIEPMIQRKILFQDAKRTIPAANFPHVEEQLTKEFEKRIEVMLQKKGFVSRRQLEEEAASQGNSLSQQKKAFLEELLAREFLQRNSTINEEIRREELLSYYRQHQDEYVQKAKVRWEQLMIRFDAFPSKEEAKFAMGKLGNRVLDGEDFATVAKTGSQGPTAKEGGKREWTSQGALVSKVLDEALFSLPVGKLSLILEDDRGYHIVRVVEKTAGGRTPFEDVQPEIRDAIKKERKSKAQQAYVEKLTKAAVIKRTLGEFKPPAESPTASRMQ